MAFKAKFNGTCKSCSMPIFKGQAIKWGRTGDTKGKTWHAHCPAPTGILEEARGEVHENEFNEEPGGEEVKQHAEQVSERARGGGADALQALDALAAALAGRIKNGVDEATVARLVAAEIAKQSVTTIRVEQPSGVTKDIKGAHREFKTLLEVVALGEHAYLYGPPGSGKSHGARQVAEALGRDYGYISLNPMTPDSRLQGFLDANGTFRDTLFRRLYASGGVFCIDEADNASGALLTTINSALENGHAAFPDGMIERHKDFVVVATGNTAGRGANPAFPDRRPFDAAFADRFVYIEWGYDERLERNIALSYNDEAGTWVEWVQKVRSWAKVNQPRLIVTPRASFKGARLLGRGLPQAKIADMVLFKGVDADTRTKVLSANPLP